MIDALILLALFFLGMLFGRALLWLVHRRRVLRLQQDAGVRHACAPWYSMNTGRLHRTCR